MTCRQAYMQELADKLEREKVIDECYKIVFDIIEDARANGDSNLREILERVGLELDIFKAGAEDK